jgi:hypothetical protein
LILLKIEGKKPTIGEFIIFLNLIGCRVRKLQRGFQNENGKENSDGFGQG